MKWKWLEEEDERSFGEDVQRPWVNHWGMKADMEEGPLWEGSSRTKSRSGES